MARMTGLVGLILIIRVIRGSTLSQISWPLNCIVNR